MEDEQNFWETTSPLDCEPEEVESWLAEKIDVARKLTPEENTMELATLGAGVLKRLRLLQRGDLVRHLIKLDPEWVGLCVDGYEDLFPLETPEIIDLINSFEANGGAWAEVTVRRYEKIIASLSAEDLKSLPSRFHLDYQDPLNTWRVRHGLHSSALKYLEKIQALGLPLQTLLIWCKSGIQAEIHFEQMERLEAAKPGSVSHLYERFNILNFGRYPFSYLIQVLEEDETDQPTYGWIVCASSEWQGEGFKRCFKFLNSKDRVPGTWLFEMAEPTTAWAKVSAMAEERGKGNFLVAHGHANKEGFALITKRSEVNRKDLVRLNAQGALEGILHPGSSIYLGGCSLGQPDSMGEDLAAYGYDVHASPEVTIARYKWQNGQPRVEHRSSRSRKVVTRFIPGGNMKCNI